MVALAATSVCCLRTQIVSSICWNYTFYRLPRFSRNTKEAKLKISRVPTLISSTEGISLSLIRCPRISNMSRYTTNWCTLSTVLSSLSLSCCIFGTFTNLFLQRSETQCYLAGQDCCWCRLGEDGGCAGLIFLSFIDIIFNTIRFRISFVSGYYSFLINIIWLLLFVIYWDLRYKLPDISQTPLKHCEKNHDKSRQVWII